MKSDRIDDQHGVSADALDRAFADMVGGFDLLARQVADEWKRQRIDERLQALGRQLQEACEGAAAQASKCL